MGKNITKPIEIRKYFLKNAKKIIDQQLWFSKSKEKISEGQKQQFDTLSKIITQVEDPINISFTQGDVGVKINDILESVANGKIAPSEAQKLMELVRSGFEMTEMQQLMVQMQNAGLIE